MVLACLLYSQNAVSFGVRIYNPDGPAGLIITCYGFSREIFVWCWVTRYAKYLV